MKETYDIKQFTGHEGWKEYLRQLSLLEDENLRSFISKSFLLHEDSSNPQAVLAFSNFRKASGAIINLPPTLKMRILGVILADEFKTRFMEIPSAPK